MFHINIAEADLSEHLLVFAIVTYALAMLSFACDFAFGRQRLSASATAAPGLAGAASAGAGAVTAGAVAAEPVAVGAVAVGAARAGSAQTRPAVAGPDGAGPGGFGGPAAGADRPVAAGAVGHEAGAPATGRPGGWVRFAVGLTVLGLVAHITAILLRGISEDRVPWGNMYEFVVAISCMAVIVLVAAMFRYKAYYIGLFVLVPVVFALGVAVSVIYTPAGSLVPALQSYWIAIHVTAMIVASGLYIVGAVTTAMYLVADRNERRLAAGLPSKTAGIMMHLPRPLILDRLSYRAILFAFPVWTFGIMAGAIWADNAWGRYWGWDPKETWSFITWVVYAGFLHARATAGWRGRRAAYIQLVGFACLMFNLIGINLWVTGLHSYAGMG
jgi:cytochrome c-type biogenesis protein CcsB